MLCEAGRRSSEGHIKCIDYIPFSSLHDVRKHVTEAGNLQRDEASMREEVRLVGPWIPHWPAHARGEERAPVAHDLRERPGW